MKHAVFERELVESDPDDDLNSATIDKYISLSLGNIGFKQLHYQTSSTKYIHVE